MPSDIIDRGIQARCTVSLYMLYSGRYLWEGLIDGNIIVSILGLFFMSLLAP